MNSLQLFNLLQHVNSISTYLIFDQYDEDTKTLYLTDNDRYLADEGDLADIRVTMLDIIDILNDSNLFDNIVVQSGDQALTY